MARDKQCRPLSPAAEQCQLNQKPLDHGLNSLSSVEPFFVTLNVDVMLWSLSALSLATRLAYLDEPNAVVFDELHFSQAAGLYVNRTFYFDVNPPLGTMLIALSGLLAGFDGYCPVKRIGAEYPESMPVWFLRFTPALLGSLVVPVIYKIMLELRFSRWTAALAASIVLMENAVLAQSRFMFVDGPFLLTVLLAVLAERKFSTASKIHPWSMWWWLWLVFLGVSMATAISIKYVGVFTAGLVLSRVAFDFWQLLPHLAPSHLFRHLAARLLLLLVVPVGIYVGIFYIHLRVLVNAGPNDDLMTSAFQASLRGGLSEITHDQPSLVAYGSQVTLRRTHGSPCWLHSHGRVYPLLYDDGRGSSHQQQVTCYSFKDVNNWWIVKHPRSNMLTVDDPIRPVRDGDIIQLVHGMTSRRLHSHDVAAPMSPQHPEVSCYIDYNILSPEQSLWQVHVVNGADNDASWLAIKSNVRLIHLNSTQALKTSGRHLGEWGFRQLEVVTDKLHNQPSSLWNVEEHRYTQSNNKEEREREFSGSNVSTAGNVSLGFWGKFWELQLKMLAVQPGASLEHSYSSDPLEWPLMQRNIVYWFDPRTNAQILLLGNPVVWFTTSLAVLVYPSLLVFYVIRRRRACIDVPDDLWQQFVDAGSVLFGGYLFHYVPYLMMERTLFLYHYLPSLLFSVLLFAAVVEHVAAVTRLRHPSLSVVFLLALIVWYLLVCGAFVHFCRVTYGRVPITAELGRRLRWLDSWDFIIRTS